MKASICIPTFDNPSTIQQVVNDCLALTNLPILIVDDGSEIEVSKLIEKNKRVQIYRQEKNLGKGTALKKAFALCVEQGFTHMLSLDGDGQHFPSEIEKLLRASKLDPNAIVIGARIMEAEKTPFVSRMGRRISNFWIFVLTGQETKDSQSGMRIYPLQAMKRGECSAKYFDFEMEILLTELFQGTRCMAVDVEVNYPPNRVSHFHKVRDNLRIISMNFRILFHVIRRVKKIQSVS